MYKLPVLCLIVLGSVDLVKEVIALKKGDVGVCITKISLRTVKRVTFTKYNNKWCGRRKCVVRVARMQPIVEAHEQPICCRGYTYQAETDDCAPLCTTGCNGGRCVGPDTCQCDPPSYLDSNHPNTCISPVCDPPCVNADCTVGNTCKCHPGYSINSNLSCVPICEHQCSNGECTAPNICSCSVGYALNETKCEPVCNNSCVNSKCVAPDTCTCLDGYAAINNTHCAPLCDNCNGNCVAPNVCECFEGYVQIDGSCRPVCNTTCENGYCSGPNECSCNEGYVRNGTLGVCVKPSEGRCPVEVP